MRDAMKRQNLRSASTAKSEGKAVALFIVDMLDFNRLLNFALHVIIRQDGS
jgi:hypothetical protein